MFRDCSNRLARVQMAFASQEAAPHAAGSGAAAVKHQRRPVGSIAMLFSRGDATCFAPKSFQSRLQGPRSAFPKRYN